MQAFRNILAKSLRSEVVEKGSKMSLSTLSHWSVQPPPPPLPTFEVASQSLALGQRTKFWMVVLAIFI